MQFHRLASFIIGIWLGASVFMDLVATQNFQAVNRAMSSMDVPGVETARKVGDPAAERLLLRYFAGEINRYLFEQWEWTELMLGLVLFLILVFGTSQKFAMTLCIFMMCVVAGQRFVLTPAITQLGRELAFSTGANKRFAVYHAAYGYSELGKLALGLVLTGRLLLRSRASKKAFVREYEREQKVKEA